MAEDVVGPSTYAAVSTDTFYALALHNADPNGDGAPDNRMTMWSTVGRLAIDGVPSKGVYSQDGHGCVITGKGVYNRKPADLTAIIQAVLDANGQVEYYGLRMAANDPATGKTLFVLNKPVRLFMCWIDPQ